LHATLDVAHADAPQEPPETMAVLTPTGNPLSQVSMRVDTIPRILTAPMLEHPIDRCIAGPALLAHVIVSRFADHLPYTRLEKRFAREGLHLAKSTMCGWMEPCARLLGHIVDAMLDDAIKTSPWIGIDPTGVLVQQKERCRRGYFWVMVAARDHVFFRYTPKQNGQIAARLLKDYKGYIQADASSVYNALFALENATEVGCWAHARRKYFEAHWSDPDRAHCAIAHIQSLYAIDEETRSLPANERTRERAARAGPTLENFKRWLDLEALTALPRSPIGKAIAYTRGHWEALTRFVQDGRLRLDNNLSELELRSIAVGRNNWTFVGTDEYGEHAAVMVSLIASCRLHAINPELYLRDVLLLLGSWPAKEALKLAPKYWTKTREELDDRAKAILASWPH
jgi:transposase